MSISITSTCEVFYDSVPVEGRLKEAIAYNHKQAARYWQDFNLYAKGMIALVQHRSGNATVAKEILASLRETAIHSEEFGMYWKENTGGSYWNQADIETQALLIETFAEIEAGGLSHAATRKTIDGLRLWLLKNKQTTQWKTTKATTEAVYALLMSVSDSPRSVFVTTNIFLVSFKGVSAGVILSRSSKYCQ